jgi:MFS family permease
LGCILGGIVSGPLTVKFGRRKILLVGDIISLVGVGLTMFASYEAIIIGRILEGITVGLNSSIASIYTSEMIPTEIRGKAGIVNMTVMNFGMIIAVALGYLVPRAIEVGEVNNMWRVVYLVAALFPLIRIILFIFFQTHETPAFLVSKEKNEEAAVILRRIYVDEADVNKILAKLIRDREYLYKSKKMSCSELFSKKYSKIILLGFLLVSLHQLAGIGAIYAFSIKVFQYGLPVNDTHPILFTLILSIVSLLTKGPSFFCIERYGRRKQYLPGLFLQAALNIAYGVIATVDGPSNMAAKILIILWPVPYSMCMGSLTFLYLGEVLPDIAMSVVLPVSWTLAFLVAQLFLPLSESIGPGSVFLFFGGYCLFGFVLLYCFMIESKGRSKAEIIALYSKIPMLSDEIVAPKDVINIEMKAEDIEIEKGDEIIQYDKIENLHSDNELVEVIEENKL